MNPTVKRTIFGVLFLAVMLGGLLFHRIAFFILFSFISFVMLSEFYRMTMGNSYRVLQDFASCMGAALVWLTGSSLFRGEPLSEALLPSLFSLVGKCGAEQSGTNYQIIILHNNYIIKP